MTQYGKLRHRHPAWTLALLLAVAVSCWGIHYKVSLYHPAVQQRCPAAKLLSQKERPAQAEVYVATGKPATTVLPNSALMHALAALATALPSTQPAHWTQFEPREDSRWLPLHALRQSTPRPPPVTM